MKNLKDLWPFYVAIAGLVVAFLSIYEKHILQWLREVPISHHIELFFVTLLAAWAGGSAAFRAERNSRNKEDHKKRIANVNRAIFNIAQIYEAYVNLWRFFIANRCPANDPLRALRIDSPQPGMMRPIRFPLDDLVFLLGRTDTSAPEQLRDLILYEGDYENLRQTVEQRALARSELWTAVTNHPFPNIPQTDWPGQFPQQYAKLLGLTDQFSGMVKSGLETTPKMYHAFRSAMVEVLGPKGIQELAFADPEAQSPLEADSHNTA